MNAKGRDEKAITARQVLAFWFTELQPEQWWKKDSELDALIAERFGALHASACAGELFPWREEASGALAEIIVLDQFSRNIFRDSAGAFAADAAALLLAQEAIRRGYDKQHTVEQRVFFYLPFMHSESALIHRRAAELFSEPGMENNYAFELKHKAIIDRFGRYPHRNAIVGRKSTPEELEFLRQPGSSF